MKKICFICLGVFLLTACHHSAGTRLGNKVKECCVSLLPADKMQCTDGATAECKDADPDAGSLLLERKASLLTW
jgi:hypothetical protein